VAAAAGISPAAIARHENGVFHAVKAIDQHAAALGLRLEIRLVGRGGELIRLADEEHAAAVEIVAAALRQWGCVVVTEAGFSEWGERGRIDLVAYDPTAGALVIVEVKTELLDLQKLFGDLDARERLVAGIARRYGWKVERRITVLGVAATAPNRRVVRQHPTLFAAFEARRLTRSRILGSEGRVLCWIAASDAGRRGWLAGRQRVRRSAA
jgi:hypothetical protein